MFLYNAFLTPTIEWEEIMENQKEDPAIDVQAELQKIVQEREKFRIQMTKKYYLEEVIPAKENGKKVIYTPGGGFGELVYAFDDTVLAIPSDNYAVYTTARRQHRKYLELVESKGLSPDLCSYDRVAAGLMYAEEGVYGKMPAPDMISLALIASFIRIPTWAFT